MAITKNESAAILVPPSGSWTHTMASNFVAGRNAIVILNCYQAGGPNTYGLTIGGDAATRVLEAGGDSHAVRAGQQVWYVKGLTGGSADVVLSGIVDTGQDFRMGIIEFNDALAATPVDVTAQVNALTASPLTITTATTTQPDTLVVGGVMCAPTGALSFAVPAGYTEIFRDNAAFGSGGCAQGVAAYKYATAAGVQSATFASTGSPTMVGSVVAFKITPADAPASPGGGYKKWLMALGLFSVAAAAPLVLGDIGGWTVYTPKPVDTTTYARTAFIGQPGTRIYLHDWENGDDATADYLMWHSGGYLISGATGSATDEFGVAYGTDPFNPQGAVKPYKSFGYTGPHRNGAGLGTSDDSDGSGEQIGSDKFNLNAGRNGKPDWWLFKRGVTHDILADLLARRQVTNPSAVKTSSSLTVPGGESTTYRSVVGAWGDPALPRPVIVGGGSSGFVSRTYAGDHVFKNVHYVSLAFDAHTRLSDGTYNDAPLTYNRSFGFNLLNQPATAVDIQFEDCLFDGTAGFIWSGGTGGELTFNRCLALYTHRLMDANTMFLFTNQSGDAILRVTDRIAVLNGYRGSDPAISVPTNSVFDRCDYYSGAHDSINSEMSNCLEMCSGSGAQIRAGIKVERNYLVVGGFAMGAQGGKAGANTGTIKDNVLQKWRDPTGTNANPGYGFLVKYGAHDVAVERNLVTNLGLTSSEKTASASRYAFSVEGAAPSWFHSMVNMTTGNAFANNVSILEGIAYGHVHSTIGPEEAGAGTTNWTVANTVTATGALSAATSCTLTDGWPGVTGSYTITFSDASTRTATLTNGSTAVSWTGAVTATATITTPAYATWNVGVPAYFATFPDVGGNTFAASNQYVGGATIVNFDKYAGATSPMPELPDTNTYIGGGGTLYADIAAFQAAVPGAIDPTRTLKRYMQEVLGLTVTSKEGAAEMAAFAKANLRKGQYDGRFLGTAIGNWVRAGCGMAEI